MHWPIRSLSRRLPALLLCISTPWLSSSLHANDDSALRQALASARAGDWSAIDHSAIAGHPLEGYVEYHLLKRQLPNISADDIVSFTSRYHDSPLAGWIRGEAISAYGDARRYDDILMVADGEPNGAENRCHYFTAQLKNSPNAAAMGGRELWHSGQSQPPACDTLFSILQSRGAIGPNESWERLTLAWRDDNPGLVGYLGKQLDSKWSSGLATLHSAETPPHLPAQLPACVGSNCSGNGALYSAIMHRATRANTTAALAAWQRWAPNAAISGERKRAIEHDLAYYILARDIESQYAWVDSVLPALNSETLLELRIRTALRERDWHGVLTWANRLPADAANDARWQYWKGRALEQLGNSSEAQQAYANAATQREFFAFAAADRLEQPYALNLSDTTVSKDLQRQVAALPPVIRAEALLRINEPGLANSEWYGAAAQLDPELARGMADYALQRGWPARLVQTTIAAKQWDALPWRFPEAYRDDFMNWGHTTGVDPYLLMAIARRESAYNPEALSPAGARGLMQLMPGTATQLSRQLGIADPGPYGILDPALNIRFGSTYLHDMLNRYDNNRLAATASYNAGPGRVDRWLATSNGEFDLFVESIPFRETRDYVQAVLAYRVIFESLANNGSTQGVSLLTPAERQADYGPSLMRR
ncbi:transglycosylase SLT domain-containing protein [Halomonas halocynthiae]|uniref:transglycosylase SLT domain-containing protein n=1 Tax=Halomonas halocynthiae TaxID=176290 RepID=UPI0004232D5B|nr:transglycosylase SLT domain-containing protein [Halomonas halocynthiae]